MQIGIQVHTRQKLQGWWLYYYVVPETIYTHPILEILPFGEAGREK
jgi:hypothetical protein